MLSFMLNKCGCDTTNFRTLRQLESLIMEEDSNAMNTLNGTNAESVMTKKVEHFVAHNETTIDYMLEKCDADVNDFPMLTMLANLLAQDKLSELKDKWATTTGNNTTLQNNITDVTKKNNQVQKNSLSGNELLEIEKEEQSIKRPPARNGVHWQTQIRLTSQNICHEESSNESGVKVESTCQETSRENSNTYHYKKDTNNKTDIDNNNAKRKVSKTQFNKPFTKTMSKYADRYLRSLYDRRAESEDVKQRSPLQRRRQQQQQQEQQQQEISNHNTSKGSDHFQDRSKRHLDKSEPQRNSNEKQDKEEEELEEQSEQIDISNVSAIEHDTLQDRSARKATCSNEIVVEHNNEENTRRYNNNDSDNLPLPVCHETKGNTDVVNDTVHHNTTLNFSSSSSLSSPQPSQPERWHSLPLSLELPNNTHQDEISQRQQSSEIFQRDHRSAIAHLLHLSTCRWKLINNYNKHNIINGKSKTPLRVPITSHAQNVQSRVSEPIPSALTRHASNNKSNNIVCEQYINTSRNNELNQKKTRWPPKVEGSLPTIYNKRMQEPLSVSPITIHRCLVDVENDNHDKTNSSNNDSNQNHNSRNNVINVDKYKECVNKSEGELSQVEESNRSKNNNNKRNEMRFMQIGKTPRQTSASNARRTESKKGVAVVVGEQQKQELSDPYANYTRIQRPRSTSQTLSSNTSLLQAIPIRHHNNVTNKNSNQVKNNCYLYNRNKRVYDNLNKNTTEPDLMIVGTTIHFTECLDKNAKHT